MQSILDFFYALIPAVWHRRHYTIAPIRGPIGMAADTHIGHVRRCNEDCFLLGPERQALFLFDGAGGHGGGDVAAGLARSHTSSILAEAFADTGTWQIPPTWQWTLQESEGALFPLLLLELARRCDDLVCEAQKAHDRFKQMCTTMIGGIVFDHSLHLVHVGDSRAYLYRDGHLQRLTIDHTARELPGSFEISQEALEFYGNHVMNWLYQAIGMGLARLDPSIQEVRLKSKDIIMFCTDGLTDMISDSELERSLHDLATEWGRLPNTLIDRALEAGGRDNVTVGVIAVS